MKIEKIRIRNMHNVKDETYDLSQNTTYFIGENGAGKTTILQAIQLALLGYIPGFSKTNESIMKHSNDIMMVIEASFDNGVIITRTWTIYRKIYKMC